MTELCGRCSLSCGPGCLDLRGSTPGTPPALGLQVGDDVVYLCVCVYAAFESVSHTNVSVGV